MTKPDPNQFAKVVLWHLAGLRADVLTLETLICEARGIRPDSPLEKAREALKIQTRNTLYIEACRSAGLPEDIPPTSTPKSE